MGARMGASYDTRSTCMHKDNSDCHGSKHVRRIVLLFTALSQSREHKDKVMENKTLPRAWLGRASVGVQVSQPTAT
jgi:hypothetical protein